MSDNLLKLDFAEAKLPGMELHYLMDSLREQSRIVPAVFMGFPAWLITHHADLTDAFKNTDDLPPHVAYQFGIMPLIGENFQSMEGERHRFFRKLATPTFRPGMIEQMDYTMLENVADELIDQFKSEKHIDLVKQFTESYPFIVIARLLGLPRNEEQKFSEWAIGILNFRFDMKRANKCRDELWAYLDPVIEDRTKTPKDDVISQLIHDELDGKRMTVEQVKSHIGIMFSAGASTTHDSIGSLIYALLTTKDGWREVKDNPALRDNAIAETTRADVLNR